MLSLLNPLQFNSSSNKSKRSSRSKSQDPSSLVISNYQIRQKLGMGSYAKVYKAIHLDTHQTVAVKIFNKSKMTPSDIQTVTSEVEIHKKLHHSNIARIYEFYQTQKKIYVFMEYCANGQLFSHINSKGPLSEKKAAKFFKQILSAMKYLKSQRIFHRDIKCQNILFDKNWNVKLVDFGFATKQQDQTFSRTFCGSPSYTAPQLLTKPKYKAQTVDVWCLGVTFYAMLFGTLPFDGKQFKNTKKNIIEFKYEFKSLISDEAKQIFKKIFVEDYERASIQDLQETDFVYNCRLASQNFINTNTDQLIVDPQILSLIEKEFPSKSIAQIVQSVSQFRLDQNCSLYYLMVQNSLAKGRNIKFDIGSPNFEKRKKKISNIRLRKLSDSYKRLTIEKKTVDLAESVFQVKKTQAKVHRPSLASIDLLSLKSARRNNSFDSPTRKGIDSLFKNS